MTARCSSAPCGGGPLVRHTGRTAAVLGRDASPVVVNGGQAEEPRPWAASVTWAPGSTSPTARCFARGLVGRRRHRRDRGRRAPTRVWATCPPPAPRRSRSARRYAVLEAMPFNVKALRGWLRDHGVDRLTIKKRGVSIDADQLRRQLRLPPRGGRPRQWW